MATAARSPLSMIFLLHIALEGPFAIQGSFAPLALPFLDMSNTTVVAVKLYAALSLATCVAAFLCWSLPEFLPGKRAFAIQLVIYHSVASTVLYQAPRFIPISFGPAFESIKIIPETLWGTLHGLLSIGFVFWWQATLGYVAMARGAPQ
ncbi:hypothetical protein EXIGLDRAFT_765809 [Exidia glandulosa HHB12029]|uniref:Uncharacterized protein n=1 Tax=Exidia glandulosa HHB12029 TaxID=1314781 RepID=A0A165K6B3_EXIGL|nr:hypothetical protein EXIGLDRAFT_765809 [Exidia glandulosa HHB12029]